MESAVNENTIPQKFTVIQDSLTYEETQPLSSVFQTQWAHNTEQGILVWILCGVLVFGGDLGVPVFGDEDTL